tara:strand:+ start:25 stop:711 length:687 start_codon:yes stop_codon:yes gene_type:complete
LKIIKFYARKLHRENGIPVPTKRTIPDWFKNAESTYTASNGKQGAGLKKCIPYVDLMMSGYVLTLPVDVYVSKDKNNNLDIKWEEKDGYKNFISERPAELGATMPRPHGFAPNHLVFSGSWAWKTPKRWSTLVCHPFNREDLPFRTVSAIMDSDAYSSGGNVPFFIREDFEGTIPKGTPFAQILPVKRAAWKMLFDPGMEDLVETHAQIVRNPETPYKKIAWHRKKYD